ncbi:hypothetical protein DM02DRAFT_695211 [Periconia macrospinosa]|uniref:Zn(2)-C6 fungal-type domain-containing protein n=1 Tax=Periconia macrospinosa TaxID=97972 RepID=A0A2V1D6Q4_9PLEO|nr:hypothetical protein DM02DRAFT_695211 [Periconia macrospinosa]
MVGVPRSKGCETCRKRSVKCDELRPSCSQCRRGGRKCPGYERRLKFVDERPNLQKRSQPQHIQLSTPQVIQTIYTRQHRTQIITTFIQDLFPIDQGRQQHSFIGGWLWLVPSVLQQKDTLDLAAESIALGYFGKKSNSKQMLMQSYSVYSRALRCLSRALQHKDQKFASETLCAALLLVHYERFMSMKGASWLQHTSGIRRMIQLRGPDRHRSGIDHAILMASKSYIVCVACSLFPLPYTSSKWLKRSHYSYAARFAFMIGSFEI